LTKNLYKEAKKQKPISSLFEMGEKCPIFQLLHFKKKKNETKVGILGFDKNFLDLLNEVLCLQRTCRCKFFPIMLMCFHHCV